VKHLGGIVALLLAAPAVAGGLERTHRQRELRWGGDLQGGEPYSYRDPRDPDRIIGFEVEIARGLARRLDLQDRFIQNDWSNLVPSLERGDFDLVLNGLEDTPALRERCLVTRPYFAFSEQLVVRRGSRLRTIEDLRGRRVGTLASSLSHTLLRQRPGVEAVLSAAGNEPYRDLELGRIDAVLLDSVIASRYGLVRPSLELADADVARGAYVIAVRRGDEDLRDALDAALLEMERSGELEEIFAKYALPPQARGLPPAVLRETTPPARFDAGQWLLFLRGAAFTLLVSLLAMSLAVPLGLMVALGRLHGGRIVRGAAHAYVEVFRGTPVLLQLFLLYYGIAAVVHLSALQAAVIGLGLNYGAYEAEVHRAALGSIPAGQDDAAAALGLSRFQELRLVLLPQALRVALPAMTNDLIALLKDSSLVSVITVVELTKQTTITAVDVRSWGAPGFACAALYLAMSYPLARLAARLERRLGRPEEHAVHPPQPAEPPQELAA
jgi:polar amino acid transport system substrate-binding protein